MTFGFSKGCSGLIFFHPYIQITWPGHEATKRRSFSNAPLICHVGGERGEQKRGPNADGPNPRWKRRKENEFNKAGYTGQDGAPGVIYFQNYP